MLTQRIIQAQPTDLCLNFANTCAWRGKTPPSEGLQSITDLLDWCLQASLLSDEQHGSLLIWQKSSAHQAYQLFIRAIELRELIYRIFYALAQHSLSEAEEDLERFNRLLKRTPAKNMLVWHNDALAVQLTAAEIAVEQLLAPVIWSAADLMIDPRAERVHCCENDECLWLFLDNSKTGKRRWCSMQSCGNRAKARRHYQRKLQAKNDRCSAS